MEFAPSLHASVALWRKRLVYEGISTGFIGFFADRGIGSEVNSLVDTKAKYAASSERMEETAITLAILEGEAEVIGLDISDIPDLETIKALLSEELRGHRHRYATPPPPAPGQSG